MFTYQTRVMVTPEQDKALLDYAALHNKVMRKLFAIISSGKTPSKSEFLRKYGITSRQYNSIDIELRGKIAAIRESRKAHIAKLETKVTKAKKIINNLQYYLKMKNANIVKLKFKIHHKKRRLAMLEARLLALKAKQKSGKISLCFGSKQLFFKQFKLGANGCTLHSDWKNIWQTQRNTDFFAIGSKGETSGCVSCVATIMGNTLDVRLRLPNIVGKWIVINNISFAYGHAQIIESLFAKRAISYRFKRDEKGWRIFVSTNMEREIVSNKQLGMIGVDINTNQIAISELDRFGNIASIQTIPCVTCNKTLEQTKATIGDAVKQIAVIAKNTGKPVVIEKLDFSKKKAEFENNNKARILSGFAYSQISKTIHAACFRQGSEVFEVNPAYTSVIGAVNYAQRYGISVHQGAAIAIARRSLGFSENPSTQTAVVPVCNGAHVTFELPVRNRTKHVWSHWADIRKVLSATLTAYIRSGVLKQPPAPLLFKGNACYPNIDDEIPSCESPPKLFG